MAFGARIDCRLIHSLLLLLCHPAATAFSFLRQFFSLASIGFYDIFIKKIVFCRYDCRSCNFIARPLFGARERDRREKIPALCVSHIFALFCRKMKEKQLPHVLFMHRRRQRMCCMYEYDWMPAIFFFFVAIHFSVYCCCFYVFMSPHHVSY